MTDRTHLPARALVDSVDAADPPATTVAYTVDVVQWRDFDGVIHKENPEQAGIPAQDVHACLVVATNPDDPRDSRVFWTNSLTRFENYTEWFLFIVGFMANNYHMELADVSDEDDGDN